MILSFKVASSKVTIRLIKNKTIMKKSKKLKAFLMLGIMSLMTVSCLSPMSDDNQEWTDDSRDLDSKIYVKTSVTSPWTTTRTSDEAVPLPAYYYLFDSEGSCIELKVVEESGVKAEFDASRGDYTIYAICGNSPDVPTKEKANLTDFYQLAAETDICMGKGSVTISEYGSVNEVQIPVSHIFSKIKLTLSGVPSSVTSIKATFSSLYESVLLNADYEGTQNVVKSLAQDTESPSTWILAESYIYPNASDLLSVSLTVTSEDGSVQEISTTTSHILRRGERMSLTSEFRALSRIEVGAVVENGWEDTSDELNFWDNTESTTESETSEKKELTSERENGETSGTETEPEQPKPNQTTYEVREYAKGELFGDGNAVVYSCSANSNGGYDLVLVGLNPIKYISTDKVTDLLSKYGEQVNFGQTDVSWRIPTPTENGLLYSMRSSNTIDGIYTKNSITQEDTVCICGNSNTDYKFYQPGTTKTVAENVAIMKSIWIIPFANLTI